MAMLPAAMAVMSIVSTGVAAYSQSQQYKAAARADEYNAAVSRDRAAASLSASNQSEEQQRRASRLMSGERRAAIAQSGTGLGGSNADVDRQSEIMAELDALNIRYEGQTESTGLLNQAVLDETSAKNNKNNSRNTIVKGTINMAATALSSKWK